MVEDEGLKLFGSYLAKAAHCPIGIFFYLLFGAVPEGADEGRFFTVFRRIGHALFTEIEPGIEPLDKQLCQRRYLLVVNGSGDDNGVAGLDDRQQFRNVVVLHAVLVFPFLAGAAGFAVPSVFVPHGKDDDALVFQIFR